jgi:hypothetical protein
MPFIRRQDIDPEMRARHDKKAKARLREALLNPGLMAEQRTSIRQELALIGPSRIYDAERPPRPGAISFGPLD